MLLPHGAADALHGVAVGICPLQEAAVPSQGCLRVITGQLGEGRIDIDERAIRQIRVREGHSHSCAVHGSFEYMLVF